MGLCGMRMKKIRVSGHQDAIATRVMCEGAHFHYSGFGYVVVVGGAIKDGIRHYISGGELM